MLCLILLLLLLFFELSLDGNLILILLFSKASLTSALHRLIPAHESRTEYGIEILLLLLNFSLEEFFDLSGTLLMLSHQIILVGLIQKRTLFNLLDLFDEI